MDREEQLLRGKAHEAEGPELSPSALSLFRRLIASLSDKVLPPVCLACRTPLADHDSLCADCWRDITFIRPPLCDRLGLPMPFDTGGVMVSAAAVADPPEYDRARAAAAFGGTMRDLVHNLKFNDRLEVRQLFGRWLVDAGRDLIADADIIVPVPLGRWRLLRRKFNQSAILADEVARRTRLPHDPLLLERPKSTNSQVGLSRNARKDNVRGAFAVNAKRATALVGRNVLLIDDVITTGATVGACAKALKRAGAARVDVLALAMVTDTTLVPA